MTERADVPCTPRERLRTPQFKAALRNFVITLVGVAFLVPTWVGNLTDATELRLVIVGYAFMTLGAALGAMSGRDKIDRFFTIAMAVLLATSMADKIRDGDRESDLIAAVLIVAFFVLPIPVALTYFRSRQDELQRSLLTDAAGVAFLATLFGSIGYAVLDALGGLEPLPPIAVPIFAAGTWVVAWVALRWRVA